MKAPLLILVAVATVSISSPLLKEQVTQVTRSTEVDYWLSAGCRLPGGVGGWLPGEHWLPSLLHICSHPLGNRKQLLPVWGWRHLGRSRHRDTIWFCPDSAGSPGGGGQQHVVALRDGRGGERCLEMGDELFSCRGFCLDRCLPSDRTPDSKLPGVEPHFGFYGFQHTLWHHRGIPHLPDQTLLKIVSSDVIY